MAITHAKVSAKPDTADATKIQPSDWNDDHVIDIFVDDEVPNGTADGTNAVFSVDYIPSPTSSLMLFVNGVLQFSTVHYVLSGTTITFQADYIPNNGASLRAWYRKA